MTEIRFHRPIERAIIFTTNERPAMSTGILKALKDTFGFIRGANGQDLFFHRSGVQDDRFHLLKEGQAVQFSIGESEKGPRAENVRVVG